LSKWTVPRALWAARAAVAALVPVIAQAPADGAMREGWLEQLFEAIQNDDPPYLVSLDDRWVSCARFHVSTEICIMLA
jgi:hypothetical protein